MKTTVYVGASLDGFIAGEGGDISWLSGFENKEVFRSYEEFFASIDAVLIGRGTFEKVLTFPSWPYTKQVFVLSRQPNVVPEKLRDRAVQLSSRPAEALQLLSRRGLSNIYVDGGRTIQAFLREDGIDELIITRVPLLLGGGIPLFGAMEHPLRFEHVRTEVIANGLVRSHYKRARI